MVVFVFNFLRDLIVFSIVTAQFAFPPNWEGFPFLHISANIGCGLFHSNHTDRCEVIAHCDFDLHFPDG